MKASCGNMTDEIVCRGEVDGKERRSAQEGTEGIKHIYRWNQIMFVLT